MTKAGSLRYVNDSWSIASFCLARKTTNLYKYNTAGLYCYFVVIWFPGWSFLYLGEFLHKTCPFCLSLNPQSRMYQGFGQIPEDGRGPCEASARSVSSPHQCGFLPAPPPPLPSLSTTSVYRHQLISIKFNSRLSNSIELRSVELTSVKLTSRTLCRTYPYQIYRYAKIAAIKLYFPKAVSIKLVPIKLISIKPISFTLTSLSLET